MWEVSRPVPAQFQALQQHLLLLLQRRSRQPPLQANQQPPPLLLQQPAVLLPRHLSRGPLDPLPFTATCKLVTANSRPAAAAHSPWFDFGPIHRYNLVVFGRASVPYFCHSAFANRHSEIR